MRSLFSRFLLQKTTARSYRQTSHPNGSTISKLLTAILPKFLQRTKNATLGMDIRKDRFPHEAVRILQEIADAHFIAFDFEFSGIAERNRDRSGKPTLQERYEETRLSVHEYQPLQIGLTVVKLDEHEGRYVLEPFNFDLSPLPLLRERQFTRKWSMNSGAVSFLQRNGFDFGKQMVHGVPYLSLQEESTARDKMMADAKRDDMVLKPDDQVLVRHIRESVLAWQSQPANEQEEYLNIPHNSPRGISPELNAFQRRLVHQIVQNEFPSLRSQSMGHFIQITNPTSEQQASQRSLEEEQRERDLARAIGFRWIIDGMIGRDISKIPNDYLTHALPIMKPTEDLQRIVKMFVQELNKKLQSRRKILIGHNCLTDIMFLYRMAVGDLPASLDEFRDRVHDLFPAIIDTKFVSNCFSEKYGRLSLGEVEKDLALETDLPTLFTPSDFGRYSSQAYLHEAGYDSYITAKVAIQMSSKLQKSGSARKKDHDRQQNEVEQAAAIASTLPKFGIQDTYITPSESTGSVPGSTIESSTAGSITETIKNFFTTATKSQIPAHETTGATHVRDESLVSNVSHTSANSTNLQATGNQQATNQSASPDHSKNNKADPSIDWRDEQSVSKLRSAFASTSIYDALDSSNHRMPGETNADESTIADKKVEDSTMQAKMDQMVKEGKMMPRWNEEGPFWEIYGNRLQVNGTQEGVLKLVD